MHINMQVKHILWSFIQIQCWRSITHFDMATASVHRFTSILMSHHTFYLWNYRLSFNIVMWFLFFRAFQYKNKNHNKTDFFRSTSPMIEKLPALYLDFLHFVLDISRGRLSCTFCHCRRSSISFSPPAAYLKTEFCAYYADVETEASQLLDSHATSEC